MDGDLNQFTVERIWYKEALEELNKRTRTQEKLVEFIKSKADVFNLAKIKTFLSIGAGTGVVDAQLLASCCPNVAEYIALEPNEEQASVLRHSLANEVNNTNLKIDIVNEVVESWSGPEEPVDLILMAFVLYHIPDRKLLFDRCRQWLSPGGFIVICHTGENISVKAAEKFGVEDDKYIVRHIHSDLRQLGFQNVKEDQFTVEFDIRDRNTHVMNFLLQKQASDDELVQLDAFLTEMLPSGIEHGQISVISWRKPQIPVGGGLGDKQ